MLKWWATVLAASMFFAGCGNADGTETLGGMTWELSAYGESDTPDEVLGTTMVSARFKADDRTVSGTGGCNGFSGHYSIEGNRLTVSDLVGTEIYCPEAGVMDQESAYLSLLSDAQRFTVDGDTLHIIAADSRILCFHKRVEVTLTADNNTSVVLGKGSYLLLPLYSNPSTGFSWDVNVSAEPVLQQIGDPWFEASDTDPQVDGAGGTQVFRFRAAETGKATLSLIYHQPWAQGYARMFAVEVTVP